MEVAGRIRSESEGSAQLFYHEKSGALQATVISALPEHGIILTLNLNQTQALLKICEQVFESPYCYNPLNPPNHLWSDTGFHFMAPSPDKKDLFWFSFGSLNCYVPTKRMKVVFQDLKTVFDRLGGLDRFIPDCHN